MAALRTRDRCLRGPWYLRFSLSSNGLPADHTTIWRWVQRYAPELNKRCRRELKPTNGSRRVDETYLCQGGNWRYLYRAVYSTGATIDFWFSAERDAVAAKRFLQKALQAPGHPRPRVITVDGNPCYPKVIAELKLERKLGRRCRCRTCPYLNNVVEQDHRGIRIEKLVHRLRDVGWVGDQIFLQHNRQGQSGGSRKGFAVLERISVIRSTVKGEMVKPTTR
jgi:transposase-like protein